MQTTHRGHGEKARVLTTLPSSTPSAFHDVFSNPNAQVSLYKTVIANILCPLFHKQKYLTKTYCCFTELCQIISVISVDMTKQAQAIHHWQNNTFVTMRQYHIETKWGLISDGNNKSRRKLCKKDMMVFVCEQTAGLLLVWETLWEAISAVFPWI